MSLFLVLAGILLLLFLMLYCKLNAFIALILVSIFVGIAEGLSMPDILQSITKGIGDTLGSLALVLAFGAMLGNLIEFSGAAHRITYSLIKIFGKEKIQWAIAITAFMVGLPMVYNAGFLVLIPLIYALFKASGIPLLYLGIPMAASLSTTHGLLPPHPAPTAISIVYGADVNLTLLYGFFIAIPTIVVAGPLFSRLFKNWKAEPPEGLFTGNILPENEWPTLFTSVFVAILPVILMLVSAIVGYSFKSSPQIVQFFNFIGDPNIALLAAVLIGMYLLGIRQGGSMESVMKQLTTAVGSIAMILLIIASGGAFKQVLLDSGIGIEISSLMSNISLSPLMLAWLMAAVLRLALGSATVAAITAAGIVLPMISSTNVRPELMVLATTSGSLMFSHINDIGFWMFKEYFNVSISSTFAIWTVMETIVAVMGLIGVLLLNLIL